LDYDVGLGAWVAGLLLTSRRGVTRAPLLGDPRLAFLHELARVPETHPPRRWVAPVTEPEMTPPITGMTSQLFPLRSVPGPG